MTHACRYAIVRFMPYPETREFANIGIVLMSPTAKFFGFRLTERIARITAFFDELDANIYRRARKAYLNELERIAQSVNAQFANASQPDHGIRFANLVFEELVKPRDGLIVARMDRIVMTGSDPRDELDRLFDHYVGRAFVTKAYQEREVEKRVHRFLHAADLSTLYREQTLGKDDAYKARLPFVRLNRHGEAVRAIKPIFLGHDDPSRLYDHGWDWLGKIAKLRRDSTLRGDVLFAAEGPNEPAGPRAQAFAEIREQLSLQDIAVVDAAAEADILAFAETAPNPAIMPA